MRPFHHHRQKANCVVSPLRHNEPEVIRYQRFLTLIFARAHSFVQQRPALMCQRPLGGKADMQTSSVAVFCSVLLPSVTATSIIDVFCLFVFLRDDQNVKDD